MIDSVTQLDLPGSIDPEQHAGGVLPCFVVGPENRLLAAALAPLIEATCLTDQASWFSPLTLVGDSGSGKSHLAGALARRWEKLLGPEEVQCLTAVDFGRLAQGATSDDHAGNYRASLWQRQLVILEDLQNLRPHPGIQHEFRLLCDALAERGGVFIVTSESEPAYLRTIDTNISDRLATGLAVRISAPAQETRQTLLALAAERRNIEATPGQIAELAARASGSAGRVLADVARWQAGLQPDRNKNTLTLKEIICVAARYLGVTQAAVSGPSRRRSLVEARQQIVRLARTLTDKSYAEIGRNLGKRDHTTMMHADRQMLQRLEEDPAARSAHDALQRILRSA